MVIDYSWLVNIQFVIANKSNHHDMKAFDFSGYGIKLFGFMFYLVRIRRIDI